MMTEADASFDVLVIGAGFSGLYALHRLRQLGLRTRVLEMAENVGGTWLYNRYPGARCDIESIEYSYSFSEKIQQEWVWTETMPAQPEIEAYLNYVADRLDLRRDIAFNTKVIAMAFDEEAATWMVRTEAGESFTAPFVVAACGILSVPLEPDIPGMAGFAGTSLFTSRWPKEGFDLTGKRVGVIGTGSSGVQLIPVVAREALRLSVFVPVHPFACKRPIIDQGYYETFNRDNVTLVDLRKSPICEVTTTGIRTEHELHELTSSSTPPDLMP